MVAFLYVPDQIQSYWNCDLNTIVEDIKKEPKLMKWPTILFSTLFK